MHLAKKSYPSKSGTLLLLGLFYSLGIRDYLISGNFVLAGFIACIILITFISWVF